MSSPQEIQGLRDLAASLSQARLKAQSIARQDPQSRNMKRILQNIESAREALGQYLSGND